MNTSERRPKTISDMQLVFIRSAILIVCCGRSGDRDTKFLNPIQAANWEIEVEFTVLGARIAANEVTSVLSKWMGERADGGGNGRWTTVRSGYEEDGLLSGFFVMVRMVVVVFLDGAVWNCESMI